MSNNPFADAIKPVEREPITHEVTNHPPFFQKAIEQDRLRAKARNMTRQDMFNNGMLTVEDMDDEELRCGRMRDNLGKIPKVTRTMEMVPRDLYDEMVAEHQRRTQEKFRQQLDACLNTMVDIMDDDTCEPKDRMEAAKYLMERVMGKQPERVQVAVTRAPWEEIAMEVGRTTRAEHAAKLEAIDAEVVAIDSVPTTNVPEDGEVATRLGVGRIHTARPSEQNAATYTGQGVGQEPNVGDPRIKPATPAPNYDNPVNSNPVTVANHELIRAHNCDAGHLSALRAAAKKRVQDAKRRRIVARALGADAKRQHTITMTVPDTDEGKLQVTVEPKAPG